jgi:CubicO group peptidase (beta-lactamase class C family)
MIFLSFINILTSNESPVIKSTDSLRFAKGYGPGDTLKSAWDFNSLAGAGAIRSSAADLLKFAGANMGGAPSVLNKAMQLTHQQTFKHGADGVGLLWEIIGLHHELICHDGRTGGFTSFLIIDLEKHVAVVMLSNTAILSDKVRGMGPQAYDIMKYAEKNDE